MIKEQKELSAQRSLQNRLVTDLQDLIKDIYFLHWIYYVAFFGLIST